MIPAAGFAAEGTADEGTNDADIELLSATAVQNFEAGKITQVKVGNSYATDLDNISVVVNNGKVSPVVPTQVTPAEGSPIDLTAKDKNGKPLYKITYGADATGTDTSVSTTPGTYYAIVTATTDNTIYNGATLAIKFKVVSNEFENAFLYEINPKNEKDVSDTTFTFNGLNQFQSGNDATIGVANENGPIEDVDISYYMSGNTESATGVTYAGNYTAVISKDGNEVKQISFTVGKFDVSTANIVLADATPTGKDGAWNNPETTSIAYINGVATDEADSSAAAMKALLEVTNYSPVVTGPGAYTATVQVPSDASADTLASITGSKTLSFNAVGSTNVVFTTQAIPEGNDTDSEDIALPAKLDTVDLSQGQSFNPSSVKAASFTVDNAESPTTWTYKPLTNKQFSYTITNADGETVQASALSTPGTYTITYTVNAAALDYEFGGSATTTVQVIDGEIQDADVYVSYDGVVNSAFTEDYNGTDFAKGITVTVKDSDGNTVPSSKYTVVITTKAGEEVTEIINAGEYNISVTSTDYDFSENKPCTFTVSQVAMTAIRISPSQVFAKDNFLAYTGSEIVPVLEYTTATANKDSGAYTADTEWNPVPDDIYTLTYLYTDDKDGTPDKSVDSIEQAGLYAISFDLNEDGAVNYTTPNDKSVTVGIENITGETPTYKVSPTVLVSDQRVYLDVPSDSWAADWAYLATTLDYMHGYNNSEFFGPFDSMKRGDVALVLYRMSLPQENRDKTFGNANDANQSYNTPFTDVDPHAYNAQAIQWASQTGIVTGYAGTTDFGPNDPVTREQFATMLARFAAKAGTDTSVEDVNAVLGKYTDGSNVADWAKDAVAWACENQIMGANDFLWPSSDIERAAIAKMTVVYQPEDQEVIVKELLTNNG